ncbi:hypothetical protein EV127DRAFT_414768 [Xylaria flabelliformis]|nr:hypothetical protein EV127DRAFT_414768 [Xylaria flabelliformis]
MNDTNCCPDVAALARQADMNYQFKVLVSILGAILVLSFALTLCHLSKSHLVDDLELVVVRPSAAMSWVNWDVMVATAVEDLHYMSYPGIGWTHSTEITCAGCF